VKILVTGAAGFLGARLTEILLEGRHTVAGFDVLDEEEPSGWQEARLETAYQSDKFTFTRGDVTDSFAVEAAVEKFAPQAVVHLASRKDLIWAEENPRDCMRLHTEGTTVVLDACRKANVSQVVIGSSAHVYGGSRDYPFAEVDPADRPLSILGGALRAAELYAHAISLRSPVNATVLRFFSVYGPRQAPRCLLPALADACERRQPMPMYGDGTAGRDMLFVDDAVVGILRVLDRPTPWRILNIGSGETTTLAQVAEQVAWLTDVTNQRKSFPPRPGEMPHTYADISAAKDSIGFNPMVGLEDGIRRYLDWHKTRPEVFKATK
jgi:UDP-glucuronate 4-epimerase